MVDLDVDDPQQIVADQQGAQISLVTSRAGPRKSGSRAVSFTSSARWLRNTRPITPVLPSNEKIGSA